MKRVGDAYVFSFNGVFPTEIEVSDVRRKNDGWHSWLTVRSLEPRKHLMAGEHNLGSTQTRHSLAKLLEGRLPLSGLQDDLDWAQRLEYACIQTVQSERVGLPFIKVGSRPQEERHEFWLLEPYLRVGHPSMLFGDSGTGKTSLAILIGGLIAAVKGPVGFLDWENDADETEDIIHELRTGQNLDIPDFFYRRESHPLHAIVGQVKRLIDQEGIVLAIIDSVGYALGGSPEDSADTLRFYSAVRQLGTTVLLIDHVKKTPDGRPIGSNYKRAEARILYEVTAHQEPDEPSLHMALRHEKANRGALRKTHGLRIDYGDGWRRFAHEQITVPELVKGLPHKEQISQYLRGASGLCTAEEIAEGTGIKLGTLKARLSELSREGKVYVSNATGYARRYSLLSDRMEEGVE